MTIGYFFFREVQNSIKDGPQIICNIPIESKMIPKQSDTQRTDYYFFIEESEIALQREMPYKKAFIIHL